MDSDGYAKLRRPDDGRSYIVNGYPMDNRNIVTYCPRLSAEHDCHINCECVYSVGSLKYIHKYIHKGGDRATLELRERENEVDRFLEGRYIGPSEACWRSFHFDM